MRFRTTLAIVAACSAIGFAIGFIPGAIVGAIIGGVLATAYNISIRSGVENVVLNKNQSDIEDFTSQVEDRVEKAKYDLATKGVSTSGMFAKPKQVKQDIPASQQGLGGEDNPRGTLIRSNSGSGSDSS